MALNQRRRTRPGSWRTDYLFLLDAAGQEELSGNWSDITLLACGLEELTRSEYCLITEKCTDKEKGNRFRAGWAGWGNRGGLNWEILRVTEVEIQPSKNGCSTRSTECRWGFFFLTSFPVSWNFDYFTTTANCVWKMGWLLFEIDRWVIIFTSSMLEAGMINDTDQASINRLEDAGEQ